MKFLITGAAGFIGFHTVKLLTKFGHKVVGLDNINGYYDVNLKYERLVNSGIVLENIIEHEAVESIKEPNYTFFKGDITEFDLLSRVFKDEKFDYVIHLAAQPGVRYSLENPHAYVQSNLVGFLNILECCKQFKIKHLVYASSSSVYGMKSKVPFFEDDRVDFPISLYAATKKSNELMAYTYSHLYRLPTTGLRFFTVYGPWGRPDMAPMLFADAISNGRPIKVFNNGDMQRDFTYVDDIVKGIVKIAEFAPQENETQPYYRILNIGNSQPIQLMEFIKVMQDALGKKAVLTMYPMQPGDVKTTYADTTRLKDLIGYKPKTTIYEGVNSFVKWYKEYYSGRAI